MRLPRQASGMGWAHCITHKVEGRRRGKVSEDRMPCQAGRNGADCIAKEEEGRRRRKVRTAVGREHGRLMGEGAQGEGSQSGQR